MKKVLFFSMMTLISGSFSVCMDSGSNGQKQYKHFSAWKNACDKLPPYIYKSASPYCTALACNTLYTELKRFFAVMQKDRTLMPVLPQHSGEFNPYVQKLIVPHDAKIIFFGDLHGDVHSLNNALQFLIDNHYLNDNFKIIGDKTYLAFLGDYTDRGWYGAEVIFTILRLKNVNPDRVFMVRGNHEDAELNARYGFTKEIDNKFVREFRKKYQRELTNKAVCESIVSYLNDVKQAIYTFYNYLPIALYVGSQDTNGVTHYIQCCHGGLEIGFNPKNFLSNTQQHVCPVKFFSRHVFLSRLSSKLCLSDDQLKSKLLCDGIPTTLNGFMWADFCVDPHSVALYNSSRMQWGREITSFLLDESCSRLCKLQTIFRAHQHGQPRMDNRILNRDCFDIPCNSGLGKLWLHPMSSKPCNLQGVKVVTFAAAPHTTLRYPYHAFGILEVKRSSYKDWKLHAIRLNEEGKRADNDHCTCF